MKIENAYVIDFFKRASSREEWWYIEFKVLKGDTV